MTIGERRRWLAAVALAPAIVGAVVAWRQTSGPGHVVPPSAIAPLEPAPAAVALVFVSGGVVHPGLYRVSTTARLSEAVAAAGGLSVDADLGRLPDLAARVRDGKQVNVPLIRSGRSTAGGGRGATSSSRLDLNTASLDELKAVPGMPAGLPEAVVAHRETWGPFLSMADLSATLGLDRELSAALRPFVRVVVPR